MKRTYIVISRKWTNPRIEIELSDEGIGIKTPAEDFVAALADEAAEPLVEALIDQLGPPATWMTRKRLASEIAEALEGVEARQIFAEAAERVFAGLKEETRRVA